MCLGILVSSVRVHHRDVDVVVVIRELERE